MSVFSFNIFNGQGHVKTWVPSRNLDLKNFNIIDVNGNDNYKLCLSGDGKVYLQGTVSWMEPQHNVTPTLISLPIKDAVVVGLSSTSDLFAFMYTDGSVCACGINFSPTVVRICESGIAQKLAVTKKSILISTGDSLLTFTSPTSMTKIELHDRQVRCVSTYEPGYLILLDDGILYCTYPVRDLGPTIISNVPGLYVVSGFLGPHMVHMETSLDEIVCVYSDGTIVYGWADQIQDTPYPVLAVLPQIPPDKALTHIHISRDLIWLLFDTGEVYYISKLSWLDPENGRVARYKKIPSSFPSTICHFRATWNEIYFFERGYSHQPIVSSYDLGPTSLRKNLFTIHTKQSGSLLVDPLGARFLGIRPGDTIMTSDTMQYTVIGRCGNIIFVKNLCTKSVETIDLPDISTILFEWRLLKRKDAEMASVSPCEGKVCQIDRSNSGISRISYFKAGDKVSHSQYGEGRIIGERCECLWIRFDKKLIMFQYTTSGEIHRQIKLVKREGSVVKEALDVQGDIVLVEYDVAGAYTPESIVKSKEYGLGIFLGIASDKYVVSFLGDCGYCRLVSDEDQLQVIMSINSQFRPFQCIDLTTKFVCISEESVAAYNLRPSDLVLIDDKFAFCVGCCNVDGEMVPLFETELMIKNGLGVGMFEKQKIDKYKLIARIGKEGYSTMRCKDGKEIKLSCNTNDFSNSMFLPGDELIVDSRRGYICGCMKDKLFIKYDDDEYISPLYGMNMDLIYRRLDVPTKRKALLSGDDKEAWIDLEHMRNVGILPGDKIENDGISQKVIGIIDEDKFLTKLPYLNEVSLCEIMIGKPFKVEKSVFS